jgi:excisionase family DNA binding protein
MARQFLTTGEIAEVCDMSQQTVIRQIDKGFLRGFKIPGSSHRRASVTAVREWMHNAGMEMGKLDAKYGLGESEQSEQVSGMREA